MQHDANAWRAPSTSRLLVAPGGLGTVSKRRRIRNALPVSCGGDISASCLLAGRWPLRVGQRRAISDSLAAANIGARCGSRWPTAGDPSTPCILQASGAPFRSAAMANLCVRAAIFPLWAVSRWIPCSGPWPLGAQDRPRLMVAICNPHPTAGERSIKAQVDSFLFSVISHLSAFSSPVPLYLRRLSSYFAM